MAADRRVERRSNRTQLASPYSQRARPARSAPVKKSSSWSFSGLLSFLNPLKSRSEEEPEERETEEPQFQLQAKQPQIVPSTPPQPRNLNTQLVPAPLSPISFSNNASPSKNVDAVKNYLSENGSRQLNPVEIAGLVSLLQDSIDGSEEDMEPFRFSRSPSRGASPISPLFTSPITPAMSLDNPHPPAKSLSKNPNGSYKWQGVGSARPRNRFHSPAFGSSRSAPSKMKITPAEAPKTDTKRRRVGADAETSSPVPAQKTNGASSSSSQEDQQPVAGPSKLPNGNGESSKANGTPANPRLLKHTTPAVPSPLRQTWGENDSPSPPQPSSKQTRAASFMTDLIREVTPSKKPDLSNPYQTASPVQISKPPTKKVPPKRTRATSKQPAVVEEEEKKIELSTQAIIEATVPKGSKRSRPPQTTDNNTVTFPASASPSPPPTQHQSLMNGFSNARTNGKPEMTVEVEEEEDGSPALKKKQKTVSLTEPIIEEVEDVDMPSGSPVKPTEVIEPVEEGSVQLNGNSSSSPVSPQSSSRTFFGISKSSIPKEPSKLRFSVKADLEEKDEESKRDSKVDVKALPFSELPVNTFTTFFLRGDDPKHDKSKGDVVRLSKSQLPVVDDFTFNIKPAAPAPTPTQSAPAKGGFDWAAAGMKAPVAAASGWSCSTCMCSNPGGVDICTVCETPK